MAIKDKSAVPIAEAIDAIKLEVMKSQTESRASDLRLEVEELEVEFSLQLRRSASGSGKLAALVDMDSEKSDFESTRSQHTVRIKFKPITSLGGVFVSAADIDHEWERSGRD